MDMNQFTEKAQQALAGAQKLAARFNHQQIDVEHALLALLDQEKGLAPAVLAKAGVSADAVTVKLQRELDKLPKVTGGHAERAADAAVRQVHRRGRVRGEEARSDEYVSVEHLLLAATDDSRHRRARRSASSASPATACSPRSKRCAAASASPRRTRKRPIRRWRSTAAT